MNIDVLEFIRTCIGEGRIYWTYHVNMRLKGRFVSREAVLLSSDTYEIIEKYPEDKYLPSYLVYAEYEKNAIHIQIAIDEVNNNIRIITAYKPSPDKWEEDLKRRKKL